jgi:hypothetical protein
MTLKPGAAPSQNFDLSDWKLQLPVDAKGSYSGKAAEIRNLLGYDDQWFETGPDGAMVFRAPVQGATTGGSVYARSELREMNGSVPAEWSLKEGGHMQATLEIDRAPTDADGSPGRIVIGQVHGGDSQLVRLYWNDGDVYYATDDAEGSTKKDLHVELTDSKGNTPNVSLNEKFSYSIDVQGHDLRVSVTADGRTYSSTQKIDASWDDNEFYFKAGTYLGVNEKDGSGFGQTSFFDLAVDHDKPSAPTVPTKPPAGSAPTKPPVEVPDAGWETTKDIEGNGKANTLKGGSANEDISGGGGNDKIYGRGGDDVLTGGNGSDTFVFDKNSSGGHDLITDYSSKSDTIQLDGKLFSSLDEGKLVTEHFVYGSRALERDDHLIYDQSSGVLYYDSDGSGSIHAVEIATFENHEHLVLSDFMVV